MKNSLIQTMSLTLTLGTFTLTGSALPLKTATLTDKAGSEVLIKKGTEAERPAAIQDVLQGNDVIRTGKKSRAELEFADKSLARLGSNTVFSFNPQSRNIQVQQGIALIHVPPNLSGAKIATPAATAAINGDVIATRVSPNGVTDFVALSQDALGPVQITFNKTGETRTLYSGQLLQVNPAANRIGNPVDINIAAFIGSNSLTKDSSGFKNKLPDSAQKEIKEAQGNQIHEMKNGGLLPQRKLELTEPLGPPPQVIQTTGSRRLVGTFAINSTGGGHGTLTIREDGGIIGFGANKNGVTANLGGSVAPDGRIQIHGFTSVGQSFSANGRIAPDGNGFFAGNGGSLGPKAGGGGSVVGSTILNGNILEGNFTTQGLNGSNSGNFQAIRINQ